MAASDAPDLTTARRATRGSQGRRAAAVPAAHAAPDDTASLAAALAAVRADIDALDEQIVVLLARREVLVRRAGALKRTETEVPSPARVEEVVARARGRAQSLGASPEVADATYRAMIGAFVALELAAARADLD
ncbi:chorismate mutase [Cellulomonas hominis]